jgi:hypothetical protein
MTLLLCACTNPHGPPVNHIGETWEERGNSVTVSSAEIVDLFETEDGRSIVPQQNQRLLLIHCRMGLADGWQIHSETYVSYKTKYYRLQETVVQNDSQGEQEYILIFALDAEACADGNAELALVHFTIEGENGAARIERDFDMRTI